MFECVLDLGACVYMIIVLLIPFYHSYSRRMHFFYLPTAYIKWANSNIHLFYTTDAAGMFTVDRIQK